MKNMNSRADLLEWKRQQLLAECNAQRADLALQLDALNDTLGSVQIGLRIVDRVRKYPGWIVAMIAAFMAITPRRLSSLMRIGTSLIRTWRQAAPMVRMLMQRS